ncbi:hypothetical protein P8452_57307 [Trifolium repens]|nr:hypothetical protein P8452_57307 [Trifolium repens]
MPSSTHDGVVCFLACREGEDLEKYAKDTPGRSFYYAMEPLHHMCLFLQWSLRLLSGSCPLPKPRDTWKMFWPTNRIFPSDVSVTVLVGLHKLRIDIPMGKNAECNAEVCESLDVDALYVSHIQVN